MKILISLLLLILSGHLPAFADSTTTSPPSETLCQNQLDAAIDAITNRPPWHRSRWGILIQTLSSANTLYRHDAENYFIPASTTKLLTTAAALQTLGSDFRIRTSVYSDGNGTFYLVGRGDPSLTPTQFKELAQQLKRQGITQMDHLIAEDGYFRGLPINPNWQWEDVQAGYGAPVNSLIVNQNAIELKLTPQSLGQRLQVTWVDPTQAVGWQIENTSVTVAADQPESVDASKDFSQSVIRVSGQLRVGSEPESVYLAVANPATNFLQQFQAVLKAEGITVLDAKVATGSPLPTREVAAVESPPLTELVKEVNQESNNLYAEALLRTMGARKSGSGGAADTGLIEVKAALTTLGVSADSYVLADGSGLSRQNLVSPEALVQTLRGMANAPTARFYRSSLPVAGVSGTLRSRFQNSRVEGMVQAKTGTLTGVSALAGYVNGTEFEPLVFSIIVNQSNQPTRTLRQAIDEIVILLTRVRRC